MSKFTITACGIFLFYFATAVAEGQVYVAPSTSVRCCGTATVTAKPVYVPSSAQTTYYSSSVARPVTTYYSASAPSVTTSYYATTATPVTSYYSPTTAYYSPATSYYAPTTSYYGHRTAYYAPTTTYYAPTTTYYSSTAVPVTSYYATPVVAARPVVVGSGLYGQPTAYVPGQPIRNALRWATP